VKNIISDTFIENQISSRKSRINEEKERAEKRAGMVVTSNHQKVVFTAYSYGQIIFELGSGYISGKCGGSIKIEKTLNEEKRAYVTTGDFLSDSDGHIYVHINNINLTIKHNSFHQSVVILRELVFIMNIDPNFIFDYLDSCGIDAIDHTIDTEEANKIIEMFPYFPKV